MSKQEKQPKERCDECKGTGLKADPDHITAVCQCAAGQARERANESLWD